MNNLKLLIGRGSTYYDYSQLITKVVWSGRKGSAPRSLEVTLIDSEGYNMKRADLNCGDGKNVIFYEDGKELFRGLLMTEKYNSKRTVTIKAYDCLIYAANNKESFSYKKKTADQIINDCLKKLGLKVGSIAKTSKKIGELVKARTTYWDVIQDALAQTYSATGKRYYLYAEKGKVYLKRRAVPSQLIPLDLTKNTADYDYSRSIYDTRTRIKLTTSKGSTKKSYIDKDLEKKIGKFQDMGSVDNKVTKTELNSQINTFKSEKAVVSQSMEWSGIGDSSVIAGSAVYDKVETINTKRILYVEEDTHTWEKGGHSMKLKLNYAKNIDAAG